MSTISIDLNKNPDVAALLADKEAGAKVYGCFTIKSMDDQTAVLRIAEMTGTKDELPDASMETEDEESTDDENEDMIEDSGQSPEGAEEEKPESPVRKLARRMESNNGMGMGGY